MTNASEADARRQVRDLIAARVHDAECGCNTGPQDWSYRIADTVLDGVDLDVYADNVRLRAELDNANRLLGEVERDRDTMRAVARSNRRHSAVHVDLLDRVEKFAAEVAAQPAVYGAEYAGRLRSLLSAPTATERHSADVTADGVDWAIRVTHHNGETHIVHADDPFTDRSVAEQYAAYARLGDGVASAVVVCREVWHGPWTTPTVNQTSTDA